MPMAQPALTRMNPSRDRKFSRLKFLSPSHFSRLPEPRPQTDLPYLKPERGRSQSSFPAWQDGTLRMRKISAMMWGKGGAVMNVLIVVDMQNDFVSGALGTPEAREIVPRVVDRVEEGIRRGEKILFTRDTHETDYLETREGK